MSSNSWRKYGGISKMNDFNTLNVSTIVADKFISRSVRPAYQYYNGTYEVSQDLSAGVNILAGNSTYTHVDTYVNRNIYANQKIYFGGGEFENTGNVFPELPPETTHAYFYGDVSNIGVNTLTPKTIFNITGKIEEDTDILTVESGNIYIRNILGQNKDAQGVVLDANDNQSNIHFYTDASTNAANEPDATIKYTRGHVLSTTTENGITSRSRYTRTDTSGGVVYFDGEGYRVDASVNMYFDSSSNIYVHASNDIRIDGSNGLLRIDDMGLTLSTDETMVLNSSGGLVQVFSEVAQFNTLLDVAPPERGISLESLHNETLTVYDNSNSVYLKNVYNDDNIQTGNAITAVAKDASANTFIRMIAPVNNRGSAMGGGVYPKDTDRSMAMFGLSDSAGSYIPSQMIVSSNHREKYASTLGINTYSPATEQYVMDVNGPMHVGNGEINTVAEMNFEIKQMSFSQNHGIVVGTPSATTTENYQQYLLYTTDGGKTWTPSDIYARTTTVAEEQFEVLFNVVDVYDSSYAFVGGNRTNFAYITNDGGKTWVRIQDLKPIVAANIIQVSDGTIRVYASELMNDLSHNIFYIDISAADLETNNTINPIKINEKTITEIIPKKSILTQTYVYLAGTNGILRYDRSSLTNKNHVVNNNASVYQDIYAYDEQNIIAVGENVISYYANGSWTTHTNNSYGNLQSVFMYDTDNIVAVGASGKFLYTKTGPAAGNWKDVPEYILNTSGMKDRLVGAENDLRGISMPDKNTFIIADVISTYVSNENTGQSKIQYTFLPNLLNREENVVIDVCGNMVISGDMYVKDDGKLYVDATTVLNGDVSMNSRLFVQEDVSLNSKLFVKSDVSLNSNLYVKEKTIHNGDVSMNSKLFVQDDVSLNGKLYVDATTELNGDVSMNSKLFVGDDVSLNSKLFVKGDVSLNSRLFVQDDVSLNSKLYVGSTTELNGDVSMNSRLFVQEDVSLNSKLFVKSDVSLNGNLYVKEKTIHNGDVSMNSKLFVQDDVSLNSKLFVQDQIRMPSLSNVLVNNIDGHNDGSSYGANTNHSHNIHIGGNTRITNIGPVDFQRKNDIGDILDNDNTNYINIGATLSDNPVIIQIGKYTGDLLKPPNRINIGGGNDDVVIAGKVQFTTQDQMRVNNKLIELNANENEDAKSANSGIIIRDNSNSRAGYLLVSNSRKAYKLQAPFKDSHPVAIETHQMNLGAFTTPNPNIGIQSEIQNGLIVLTRELNSDASYSMVVRPLDISNILVRDAATSNDQYQNILTNLIVQKDISLNRRLFVQDNASFNANVYINQDLTIDGNLMVRQQTTNQYIINTTTTDYTLIVAEDMSLNGRMYVEDDVSLNGNLYVRKNTVNQGDVRMNSKLYVHDDVSLNANFYVDSTTTLKGAVAIENDLVVDLTTVNKGDVSMNSQLKVGNDARFNKDVYISGKMTNYGDVSMNSRLTVDQDTSFNSNVYINKRTTNNGDVLMNSRLTVDQDASFNSNVYINKRTTNNGDVSMNSRLFVGQDASFNSNVYINKRTTNNGDVLMNSRLTVDQDASFNKDVYISGKMTNYGDVSFNRNVYINNQTTNNGDVSMNSRLFVGDDASFNSNVYISKRTTNNGDVLMNSRLTVGQDASFNQDVYITGDLSLNGDVYASANIEVDGSMNIAGNVSIGKPTSAAKLEVYRDAAPNVNNETTGTVFNASYIRTAGAPLSETGIRVGKYNVDEGMNRTDIPLAVYGNGNELLRITTTTLDPSNNRVYIQPWVGIGTANPTTSVDISYTDAIRIPHGNTDDRPVRQTDLDEIKEQYLGSIRYNTETEQFEGFGPGKAWGSLGGVINIAQTTKIIATEENELQFFTDGSERMRIYASGDISMNKELYVHGDASFSSAVYISGTTTLNGELTVGNDASFNQNVYITGTTTLNGDVSMNSRLFVGEDASFNKDVYITGTTTNNGDVLMNNNLHVGQDASFNENVYITGTTTNNGDVSMNNNLHVGQDASFNENVYITGKTTLNGDVSMNNNLHVGQDASFNENVYITGTTTLNGDVSMNSRLYVGQDASFNENVYITGTTTLNGDVSMNSRLYVGQDASFNKDIIVNSLTVGRGPGNIDKNTAVGYQVLNKNTTGDLNTAVGYQALTQNESGYRNTAIGYQALNANTDGYGNTAIGYHTLTQNESGYRNTAIGYRALEYTTGNNNIAIGYIAGSNNTSGSYNMFIGSNTGLDSASNIWNSSTAIGHNAKITASSQIVLGTSTHTVSVPGSLQASEYTSTSDYRIKENITPLKNENYKVDELNPVSYFNKSANRKDIGLIAHELQEHFPFLVNGEKDGETHQSVNYIGLIGLLIHEVQQLKVRVSELESQQR